MARGNLAPFFVEIREGYSFNGEDYRTEASVACQRFGVVKLVNTIVCMRHAHRPAQLVAQVCWNESDWK